MVKNWLSAGAWNALLVGAIVWGAAKMFGQDASTASALGAAASIGLFAGELAGHWAANYGTSTIASSTMPAQLLGPANVGQFNQRPFGTAGLSGGQ